VRTIIHADMDAFYASIEQLDRPELRGKPVVVGGSAEGRGVVAAASYEARAFRVRSAMPMSRALRLCPDLVRVSPRFGRYAEVSRQVMDTFRALTPLVEPLSLDEAFLDVTGWVVDGAEPEALGRELKREVHQHTGLTMSAGVATSKSVAKIASDMRKPDGLVVVAPGTEAGFLAPLSVRALWGIGPKAEASLVRAGIKTVGDLAACADGQATRLLGSGGVFFRDMARGIDPREVITEHERKSIGAETTFAKDLLDGADLRAELHSLSNEVGRRMRKAGARASTVSIKLRYHYFKTVTRQHTLASPTDDAAVIERTAGVLLDGVAQPGDQFRLLGVQCSKLVDEHGVQGVLWEPLHSEDNS
jgi:DNA polymerase-4